MPQPGGQIAPPTRSEIERVPQPERTAPPSRLTISGDIERAPCPLDAPRVATVRVTVSQVIFDQLGPVDPATLAPAWQPYAGQSVPLATICEIRDAAATILRRQGYVAAVQVPPQRIEGGTIHFSVLMAKLVAIHVRGDAGHAEAKIAGYLESLKGDAPFNRKVAERALLLAGDLPGFSIHLTLRSAGTTPGEVIGDVTVARTPFAADVNVQNFGSHSVGRWSGLVDVEADDLLGLGDRAVLGVYNTADLSEQGVVQGSYEIRPGTSGLTIAARGTYARTHPDTGDGDPIRAETLIGTVEASYPLIRRQVLTLRTAGGLDLVSQKLRFGGLPFTDDQLRVLYARLDIDAVDPASIAGTGEAQGEPRWRATGAVEFRQGIAGLGASHDCGPAPLFLGCLATPSLSRFDADPQGTVIRASGSVAFTAGRRLSFAVSPRAQIAFDPLLSFEQFSAGNYTIGRGYDPGALVGDSGYGVQTEARFGPLTLRRLQRIAVQPFVFVDLARAWTLGPTPSVYRRDSLVTLGGGGRVAIGNAARAEFTLAKPVGETPLFGQAHGLRLLVSFTTRFSAGR